MERLEGELPGVLLARVDDLLRWARHEPAWPSGFALSSCGVEVGANPGGRFGGDPFRSHPRQADLMIVFGTVTTRLAPLLLEWYEQLAWPKLVMALGDYACDGGPFAGSLTTVSGLDRILPVDVLVEGCPPGRECLLRGLDQLRARIDDEPALRKRKDAA